MIKQLIITGANTAREINPFVKPVPYAHSMDDRDISEIIQDYHRKLKRFEESESSLKEYRITEVTNYSEIDELKMNICPLLEMMDRFPIGSKVECEVNEETLEAIVL